MTSGPQNGSDTQMTIPQAIQAALVHHKAGRLQQAEQIYQAVLAQDPSHVDANHYMGAIALQVGKPAIAVQFLEKAIATAPDFPELYNKMGLTLQALGRTGEAIDHFKKFISLNPGHAPAYYNLGLLHQEAGNLDAAVENYDKALAAKPDYPEALINSGLAFHDAGHLEEAISRYRKAITMNPGIAQAHQNLGNSLKLSGLDREAAESYQQALAIDPNLISALVNLGVVHNALGKPDQAIECYQKAISLKPDLGEAHYNLGVAHQASGDLAAAIQSYQKALDLFPGSAKPHNNLGTALQASGRPEDAITHFKTAITIDPGFVRAHINLGNALKECGQTDEAAQSYREALATEPASALAHKHLSYLVSHETPDGEIRAMEALYARENIPSHDKMLLGFGLGKAYADLGEPDKAVDYFTSANRLKRAEYTYDPEDDAAVFKRIKAAYTPALFSRYASSGITDTTPIFILGMPRSGTSLVEQILASHPRVFGAGELKTLGKIAARFTLDEMAAAALEETEGVTAAFKKAGEDYIREIRQISEAGFITDKMPHNFMQIGLIKLILPDARIIHCTRDSMDTCFSIYKHLFDGDDPLDVPLKYAYDMDELGRFYNLYTDMMRHWHETLPGWIYDISYETLVADQAPETQKLLEFCGLPWDDACLSFHKTQRPVATASFSQVRQPIYTDSIGLWKAYAPHLAPLQKVVSPNIP